jgi:hypothetical protein
VPDARPAWQRERKEIGDDVLALLEAFTRLRESPPGNGPPRTTLNKAAEEVARRPRPDVAAERQQLRALGRYLAPDTESREPIELHGKPGRRGTFATPEAIRMAQAVRLIRRSRERELARRRELEDIQLVSAVDQRVLRIGGRQSHYERFLGVLVGRLHTHFPWIRLELRLVPGDGTDRDLGRLFRSEPPEIDYLLVEDDHPETCYEYTLRVVGTAQELARLGGREGRPADCPAHLLDGEPLLAAPPGHASRDRLDRILRRNGVAPARVVEEPSPLMRYVRALAGEGFAVMSDEYSAVGRAGAAFPHLLDSGHRATQTVRLLGREELRGGVHTALQWEVAQLRAEEAEQGWEGRPAALG